MARRQEQHAVVNAAFESLAKCDVTLFQVRHLPVDVIGSELAGALQAAAQHDDDIEAPPITGKMFVDLMLRLKAEERKGATFYARLFL